MSHEFTIMINCFRRFSQYVHWAPRGRLVCQRHAAYVRSVAFTAMFAIPDFHLSRILGILCRFLRLHQWHWNSRNRPGWTGGILGIYLSRNNRASLFSLPLQFRSWISQQQRSVVPSIMFVTSPFDTCNICGWLDFRQHFLDRLGDVWSCPSPNAFYEGKHILPAFSLKLKSASQVHGMFGKTLMLAALTRIVEVCYFVPSYSALADPVAAADTSEDVFPDGAPLSTTLSPRSGAEAWQHLPPFVSPF